MFLFENLTSACMYGLPDLTVEEATTAGVLRHHLLAHALQEL